MANWLIIYFICNQRESNIDSSNWKTSRSNDGKANTRKHSWLPSNYAVSVITAIMERDNIKIDFCTNILFRKHCNWRTISVNDVTIRDEIVNYPERARVTTFLIFKLLMQINSHLLWLTRPRYVIFFIGFKVINWHLDREGTEISSRNLHYCLLCLWT